MRTTTTLPVVLLLLLILPAGCVRAVGPDAAFASGPSNDESPPAPAELREVILDPDDSARETPPSSEAPAPAAVATPPMQMMPLEPMLFRIGAGYGALGRLDLATCREKGLPQGYLHVRVTFRHSGRVVRAAVESPVAPPREALDCIGEQLEIAMVPVFDGSDVTLSKSFFVN
jgi:hypothetical protein